MLISVTPKDRAEILDVAKALDRIGFKILATEGTHRTLVENGIPAVSIKKVQEGRPNIVDAIHNHEIDLIINTPIGKSSKWDDSYIRKTAIKYKVPYITTTAAAQAAVEGIEAYQQSKGDIGVKSLQAYHAEIR